MTSPTSVQKSSQTYLNFSAPLRIEEFEKHMTRAKAQRRQVRMINLQDSFSFSNFEPWRLGGRYIRIRRRVISRKGAKAAKVRSIDKNLSLRAWRLGAKNFLEVILLNILSVRIRKTNAKFFAALRMTDSGIVILNEVKDLVPFDITPRHQRRYSSAM